MKIYKSEIRDGLGDLLSEKSSVACCAVAETYNPEDSSQLRKILAEQSTVEQNEDQNSDDEDNKDQNKQDETEASWDTDYDISEYKLDEQLVDTDSDQQSS